MSDDTANGDSSGTSVRGLQEHNVLNAFPEAKVWLQSIENGESIYEGYKRALNEIAPVDLGESTVDTILQSIKYDCDLMLAHADLLHHVDSAVKSYRYASHLHDFDSENKKPSYLFPLLKHNIEDARHHSSELKYLLNQNSREISKINEDLAKISNSNKLAQKALAEIRCQITLRPDEEEGKREFYETLLSDLERCSQRTQRSMEHLVSLTPGQRIRGFSVDPEEMKLILEDPCYEGIVVSLDDLRKQRENQKNK